MAIVKLERTFKCPKCGTTVKGVMREAGHRCPQNRSLWTPFEEQP